MTVAARNERRRRGRGWGLLLSADSPDAQSVRILPIRIDSSQNRAEGLLRVIGAKPGE
jgi:hypothetical protein